MSNRSPPKQAAYEKVWRNIAMVKQLSAWSMRKIACLAMDGLGIRIKEAAERIGGLNKLSEKTSVPRRTFGDFVAEKSEPKASILVQIANLTGVRLEWLITGGGEKDEHPPTAGVNAAATLWINMVPNVSVIVNAVYGAAGVKLPEHRRIQEVVRWHLALTNKAGDEAFSASKLYELLPWLEDEIAAELEAAKATPGTGKHSA